MLISDKPCIAKIENVSGKHCHVELIFDGAIDVVKEEIYVDVAAHIETTTYYDEASHTVYESSHQVGEAGYKPFVDKLKEMYPRVLLIDKQQFDVIIKTQQAHKAAIEALK